MNTQRKRNDQWERSYRVAFDFAVTKGLSDTHARRYAERYANKLRGRKS